MVTSRITLNYSKQFIILRIMNLKITKLLIIACHISSFCLSQVDRSKIPESGPAPLIKIEEAEFFRLKNGLQVFVVRRPKIPTLSIYLEFDIPPTFQKEKIGYVDLAGRMLRKGTLSKPKQQLDEEIDFIGATIETSSSAIYGWSLKRHAKKLWEIFADVTRNPSFPKKELQQLKKEAISNLAANKSNPDAIMENIRSVLLYGDNHPYGQTATKKSINNITIKDCKKYYYDNFSPNIGYLAIVGDVNLEEAKEWVNQYFSDWKGRTISKTAYPIPPTNKSTRIAVFDRSNSVQSTINIAHTINLSINSPDIIQSMLMNTILGGGYSSRLFQNLRETHAYTYGCYSSLNPDNIIGSFVVSTNVRTEVTDSAITQILIELERMKNHYVSEEELTGIKNFVTGSFIRSLENPRNIARFAINIKKHNLSEDHYKNYLQKIQEVSSQDIKEASIKYLNSSNTNIIVVGNAEEIDSKIKIFWRN